jgi:hypothetical protein
MLLSGRRGLRNKNSVSSLARNIYHRCINNPVFSLYALYKLRPKQEILCLIQIKQNGEFIVANEKDTNHHIFYLGGRKNIYNRCINVQTFSFYGLNKFCRTRNLMSPPDKQWPVPKLS